MRRLFAILLLVVLPLQAVWAVAAPYCGHEGGAGIHLGHHFHDHKSQDADSDKKPGLDDHRDCHACHGACAALTHESKPHGVPMIASGAMPEPSRIIPSPPLERPERPNWHSLV